MRINSKHATDRVMHAVPLRMRTLQLDSAANLKSNLLFETTVSLAVYLTPVQIMTRSDIRAAYTAKLRSCNGSSCRFALSTLPQLMAMVPLLLIQHLGSTRH
jgi:hypothetical protein